MIESVWLDRIPLWMTFACSFVLVLLGIGIGFLLGTWRRRKMDGAGEPIAAVVVAVLGLLGFMLAFTFDMAASRFYARRQILLDEVNAIERAFLCADLIAEPQRTQSRELLKRYVRTRIVGAYDVGDVRRKIADSEKLQNELWVQAFDLAQSRSNSEIDALFVDSLNRLVDLDTMRTTTALQYRIPMLVWGALFLLALLGMVAVGYQSGLYGQYYYVIYTVLAFSFSLVIMMISEFDSVSRGLTVNQGPLVELRDRLDRR